jgi:glycerol uptake facilitator protein
MNLALGRRLLAEGAGTALLVIFGPGALVAALALGGGKIDAAGLVAVALSFGLVIAIVVYAIGHTSGGHINPAVTIALAVSGRFPWAEVAPYIVAQLAGALVGGLVIVGVVGTQATDLLDVGATELGPGVGYGSGILAEAVGTFLLQSAIMAMAIDERAPQGWSGWIVGLSVSCAILVVGPFTGGSLNPARTFGPYLTSTLFGGSVPWGQMTVYVIGPLVGSMAAALGYDALIRPGFRPERAGREGEVAPRTGSE